MCPHGAVVLTVPHLVKTRRKFHRIELTLDVGAQCRKGDTIRGSLDCDLAAAVEAADDRVFPFQVDAINDLAERGRLQGKGRLHLHQVQLSGHALAVLFSIAGDDRQHRIVFPVQAYRDAVVSTLCRLCNIGARYGGPARPLLVIVHDHFLHPLAHVGAHLFGQRAGTQYGHSLLAQPPQRIQIRFCRSGNA